MLQVPQCTREFEFNSLESFIHLTLWLCTKKETHMLDITTPHFIQCPLMDLQLHVCCLKGRLFSLLQQTMVIELRPHLLADAASVLIITPCTAYASFDLILLHAHQKLDHLSLGIEKKIDLLLATMMEDFPMIVKFDMHWQSRNTMNNMYSMEQRHCTV